MISFTDSNVGDCYCKVPKSVILEYPLLLVCSTNGGTRFLPR